MYSCLLKDRAGIYEIMVVYRIFRYAVSYSDPENLSQAVACEKFERVFTGKIRVLMKSAFIRAKIY